MLRRKSHFPIMGGQYIMAIPWSLITPHEKQAKSNHDQSLKRIAERGGLDPLEAVAVIEDKSWRELIGPDPIRGPSDARAEKFERRLAILVGEHDADSGD